MNHVFPGISYDQGAVKQDTGSIFKVGNEATYHTYNMQTPGSALKPSLTGINNLDF